MSQTLDAQTSGPTVAAGLQTPVKDGLCPVTVGMVPPFATFAVHVDVGVLQYSVDKHALSTRQPPVRLRTARPTGLGVVPLFVTVNVSVFVPAAKTASGAEAVGMVNVPVVPYALVVLFPRAANCTPLSDAVQ